MVAALKSCAGGGVLLPAGHTFLLRPIELPPKRPYWKETSRWTDTQHGQILPLGSARSRARLYPVFVPKKESLLHAVNSAIVIQGTGTVHGSGENWWPLRNKRMPPGQSDYWHNCRPSLLELGVALATSAGPAQNEYLNVDATFVGFTLENSPFWTTSLRGMRGLVIDRVSITAPCGGYSAAPNTDGFNVGFSDGVSISNSYVRNGDDCVPLFAVNNVTGETLGCGNGLVPCIWPPGSQPGHGGNITNVLFLAPK